jgi:putative spermidine/putrescine transport system permease protein
MMLVNSTPESLLTKSVPIVVAGAIFGTVYGQINGLVILGFFAGAFVSLLLTFLYAGILKQQLLSHVINIALFGTFGLLSSSLHSAIFFVILSIAFVWFVFWITEAKYRATLLPYLSSSQVAWHYLFRLICGAIFLFLITPILVVLPLSFNAQDFFTFTPEMLRFQPEGYSLKHYRDFLGLREDSNGEWLRAFQNSLIIAPLATLISVTFGTLAAIGLSQSHVPMRRAIMAVLISPMIVPLIISATGMFFFYSDMGNFLEQTVGMNKDAVGYVKVVLAHAVLGIPFVIITVTATLVGFDRSLTRASANLGANSITTFFRVQMPLILPGVISGGLFAFITSFDEVVVVMFIGSAGQKTLPWQMFLGLREQISPTILAVATILVVLSIALLSTVELLRRRSERLRGMSPS